MRGPYKLPPQVFRLLLLVVGIVVTYSTARYFLTPPSFHQYGWYRGEALAELASRPLVFAGKQTCADCHADEYEKLQRDGHKSLSCEACHGPGQAHAEAPMDVKMQVLNYCTRCHEANPSRPAWHKQIVIKDHYSGVCRECHVPHAPSEAP